MSATSSASLLENRKPEDLSVSYFVLRISFSIHLTACGDVYLVTATSGLQDPYLEGHSIPRSV